MAHPCAPGAGLLEVQSHLGVAGLRIQFYLEEHLVGLVRVDIVLGKRTGDAAD